jgi:predicted component of type VI protein secretion system
VLFLGVVLRYLAIFALLGSAEVSAQGVAVRATCAAQVATEHSRTLGAEVERALADATADGYSLDVTLEKLEVIPRGGELEVRVSVRALVADEHGAMRWSSTAKAVATGRARERDQLVHDAIIEAAHAVATTVRTRLASR